MQAQYAHFLFVAATQDRDDRGQFCIYDENFVRRHADGQVETHALWVANRRTGGSCPARRRTGRTCWTGDTVDDEPDADGLTEEDHYSELVPYDPLRRAGRPS